MKVVARRNVKLWKLGHDGSMREKRTSYRVEQWTLSLQSIDEKHDTWRCMSMIIWKMVNMDLIVRFELTRSECVSPSSAYCLSILTIRLNNQLSSTERFCFDFFSPSPISFVASLSSLERSKNSNSIRTHDLASWSVGRRQRRVVFSDHYSAMQESFLSSPSFFLLLFLASSIRRNDRLFPLDHPWLVSPKYRTTTTTTTT